MLQLSGFINEIRFKILFLACLNPNAMIIQKTNVKKILLLEDSPTSSVTSAWWKEIVPLISSDHIIMWWHNPGFVTVDHDLKRVKSLPPSRLQDILQFQGSQAADNIANKISSKEVEEKFKYEWAKFVKNFEKFGEFIPVSEITSTVYKSCRIGIAAISTIASSGYDVSNGSVPKDQTLFLFSNILYELTYAEFLLKEAFVDHVFFTERTYNGLALLEYFIRNGATFYEFEFIPAKVTSKNCLPEVISYSPSFDASRKRITEEVRYLEGRPSLMKRLKKDGEIELKKRLEGTSEVNNMAITTDNLEMNRLIKMAKDRSSSNVKNNLTEQTHPITCVMYLCLGTSDGLHYEGFSGFHTELEFFSAIASALSAYSQANNIEINIVIKPHPGLYVERNIVMNSRLEADRKFTQKIINQIIKIHPNVSVVGNNTPNRELLQVNNSIHCSHHGSIGIEALYLGKRFACSPTSLYCGMGFGETILKNDHKFNQMIDKWISDVPICKKEAIHLYVGIIESYKKISPFFMLTQILNLSHDETTKKLLEDHNAIEKQYGYRSQELLGLHVKKILELTGRKS